MNTLEQDIFTLIYDIYISVIEKKCITNKILFILELRNVPKNGKRADSLPYKKKSLKTKAKRGARFMECRIHDYQ